jgi:hypothetical protein
VGPKVDLDAVDKKQCFTPAMNRTSVVQSFAIPTELSRLLFHTETGLRRERVKVFLDSVVVRFYWFDFPLLMSDECGEMRVRTRKFVRTFNRRISH